MVKKAVFIIVAIILSISNAYSQLGGDNVYEFLNFSNSSRISGIGGEFSPVRDNDITTAITNPSLITSEMDNKLAFNIVDYFAGTSYGNVSYSKTFKEDISFVANLQFLNYGKLDRTNVNGDDLGEFSASDYALTIGWARMLSENWSIGANLKNIYSHLDSYNSYGIAVDVAANYYNEDSKFGATVIVENIGRQIVSYTNGNNETLPFDIELGISKTLEHLPFTFYLLTNNLHVWNLRYDDPANPTYSVDPFTGEEIVEKKIVGIMDNLGRHIVVGGELSLGKFMQFRLGYNYKRRQELKVANKPGTAGFSFGVGINVYRFNIHYARETYSLAGAANHFTIITSLNSWIKK